jgi:hypothetical protein
VPKGDSTKRGLGTASVHTINFACFVLPCCRKACQKSGSAQGRFCICYLLPSLLEAEFCELRLHLNIHKNSTKASRLRKNIKFDSIRDIIEDPLPPFVEK